MNDVCLYWGPLIGIAVSMAKRIPWIGQHSKTLAAVFAVLLGVYRVAHPGAVTPAISELVACAVQQYALAIATFETVVKPVSQRVGLPKDRRRREA